MLPISESGVGTSTAFIGEVGEGGLAPTASGSENPVAAISRQSSKALQELVARRTVLAVMSHVIQVLALHDMLI